MNIHTLRREIKQKRRAGATYAFLSSEYGVSKPEIGRILKGHYPGPVVAVKLGLAPKCYTCKRKLPVKKQAQPVHLSESDAWWRSMTKEQRQQIIKQLYQTIGAF